MFACHIVAALCNLAERCAPQHKLGRALARRSIRQVRGTAGELIELNVVAGEQIWQVLMQIPCDSHLIELLFGADRSGV